MIEGKREAEEMAVPKLINFIEGRSHDSAYCACSGSREGSAIYDGMGTTRNVMAKVARESQWTGSSDLRQGSAVRIANRGHGLW